MSLNLTKIFSGRAAVAALALVLAGCNQNPFEITRTNCPAAAVVSNIGTYTRFAGEGRNAEDVAYNVTISGITGDCTQDGFVMLNVAFSIYVSKGPAFDQVVRNNRVTVPYFVALMRDNNMITAKQIYEVDVRFAQGQSLAGSREYIAQSFEDVDMARRYDYELLIGFQLEDEDVAYTMMH